MVTYTEETETDATREDAQPEPLKDAEDYLQEAEHKIKASRRIFGINPTHTRVLRRMAVCDAIDALHMAEEAM